MDGATLPISSPQLHARSRTTSARQVLRAARTAAFIRDGALIIGGDKGRDLQNATTEIDRG
jgi:hypothetical protein